MKALLLAGVLLSIGAGAAEDPGIAAFNQALASATMHMDNAATLALWDDEGVSLLPSTEAIVGKKAISEFLARVMQQLQGARMKSFDMQCGGLELHGDWASEWCDEHQVVELGNGKPDFDGHGRMLLVLHRGAGHKWRLRREMWQSIAK